MGACETATGAIGALLVRRRVLVIDDYALGHQIGKLLVAVVAQEKRFAAVADEDERVVRKGELGHFGLRANEALRRGGAALSRFTIERCASPRILSTTRTDST
jgi:hypothetical protein